MKILSVTNQKGGTGKSTITILLAVALKSENNKVAILDCDTQFTISHLSDLNDNEGIEVIKSNTKDAFNHLINLERKKYDYVFIDFARLTEYDTNTVKLIQKCSIVFVPILGGVIEVLSVRKFAEILNKIDVPFIAFLNKYRRLTEDKRTIEIVKEDIKVMTNIIQDLKIFKDVSMKESILNTEEGKKRFKSFYIEFKNLLNNY